MALHGLISVNGQPLGSWKAQRIEPREVDEDTVGTYEVEVTMRDGESMRTTLTHRYGDGAVALLHAMLGEFLEVER